MGGTPSGSVLPDKGPNDAAKDGTARWSSRGLQSVALALVGLSLLIFFFKDADFAAIAASFSAANGWLIALAIAATMVSYVVRAFRWRYLLAPVGWARLGICFETTVIGFMVNFLVPPGRLGELVRPYLLARREGLSASSTFATVFLERVLDLATVVLLVGGWLLFGPAPPGAGGEEAVNALKVGGLIAFTGVALGLGVLFLFARDIRRGGSALAWLETAIRKLPAKLAEPGFRFIKSFGAGLGVLDDRSNLARAGFLSVILWLNISFALWLAIHAFRVDISLGATFLVIGFLTVGVAVPTPGAVGGYHVMCSLALTLMFAVNENTAKAIALASHAIAFIPVTLLGLVFFVREGMSLRDIRNMSGKQ
jgi:glycosyltransferase 2 family protein